MNKAHEADKVDLSIKIFMTLKQYLLFMAGATLAAWLSLILVIFLVDPYSGPGGVILFYLSLYLAILGTISIIGFFARLKFRPNDIVISREVSNAFRQGFFLAFLLVSILYLQSKDSLVWWNMLLLIAAMTILEFLFISHKKNR